MVPGDIENVAAPAGQAAPDPTPDLAATAGELGTWLREAAWPLWLEHGVDWERGAFHESLDHASLTCPATMRRLRVAARQTWVFSHAARAGLPRAADAVELGLGFLSRHAAEPEGGYAWRFGLDNRPTDRTRDLYDHAFVLLALSGAAGLLGAAALRGEALALLGYIQDRFPHAHGGYLESLPPALPRRQNPHMHLLEALLAADEAFGDAGFAEAAEEVLALFLGRLLDPATGALPEYFDDVLAPHREGGRFVVEPGHHCEWVWLLRRHRDAAARAGRPAGPQDLAALDAAEAGLLRFVDRHGADPATNALRDELWSDGAVRSAGARLWPQTERLKAEILRPDATPARIAGALSALDAYLRCGTAGLWHERRGADGRLALEAAPASSLYHLTGAILFAEERLGACPG